MGACRCSTGSAVGDGARGAAYVPGMGSGLGVEILGSPENTSLRHTGSRARREVQAALVSGHRHPCPIDFKGPREAVGPWGLGTDSGVQARARGPTFISGISRTRWGRGTHTLGGPGGGRPVSSSGGLGEKGLAQGYPQRRRFSGKAGACISPSNSPQGLWKWAPPSVTTACDRGQAQRPWEDWPTRPVPGR